MGLNIIDSSLDLKLCLPYIEVPCNRTDLRHNKNGWRFIFTQGLNTFPCNLRSHQNWHVTRMPLWIIIELHLFASGNHVTMSVFSTFPLAKSTGLIQRCNYWIFPAAWLYIRPTPSVGISLSLRLRPSQRVDRTVTQSIEIAVNSRELGKPTVLSFVK